MTSPNVSGGTFMHPNFRHKAPSAPGDAGNAGAAAGASTVTARQEPASNDGFDTGNAPGVGGPKAGQFSEEEQWIIDNVFGGVAPNPDVLAATREDLKDDPEFLAAVAAGKKAVQDPSQKNIEELASALDAAIADDNSNILEVVLLVLKESSRETMEDQRYWLSRMQEANMLSDAIADYMKELTEASYRINEDAKGRKDKHKDKAHTSYEVKTWNITTAGSIDAQGNLAKPEPISVKTVDTRREHLDREIKQAETMATQAKNLSDRYETQFQGADQQKNTITQLMASVMRTLGDLRTEGAADKGWA